MGWGRGRGEGERGGRDGRTCDCVEGEAEGECDADHGDGCFWELVCGGDGWCGGEGELVVDGARVDGVDGG